MNKRYISTMSLSSLKKQSGSALIIAIFVLIVIALLGASLVSLQRDNAQGASYEVYAARAYLSAYTGSEIALTELFPLGASADCSVVNSNPSLPSDTGFHACSVSVSCSELGDVDSKSRFKIVSTALCETTDITARRQITVEAIQL